MIRLAMFSIMLVTAALGQSSRGSSATATVPQAAGLRIVTVRDAQGELKGAFQTRPGRYRAGTSLPLKLAMPLNQHSVRTDDGRIVNGFGFYAWDEVGATHVRVLLLVPAPGVENKYLWPSSMSAPDPTDLFQAREFAYYKLAMGEAGRVDEMKRLGLEPMQLKIESSLPAR